MMTEPIPAANYCAVVLRPSINPVHIEYHNTEYGFPSRDDSVLFERLVLEINQAGLSWEIILRKRAGFWAAYEGFKADRVALYDETDRARLLADTGIIRNQLKVNAAIHNAGEIVKLIAEYGSFAAWLDHHHPLTKIEWLKLFKQNFLFVGGEIIGEFLMSLGYLPGAHHPSCPFYELSVSAGAPWAAVGLMGD